MKDSSKKNMVALKMYHQNGTGGKAPKPLSKQNGTPVGKAEPYKQNGKGVGKSEPVNMVGMNHSFLKSYKEANAKRKNPMIMGSSKASQKGKASLESVKNGKNMYLAGNETNRA